MGNPVTCPTEQLLLNHDFTEADDWVFTGPGWAIVDDQMVFTAVNDGDSVHQNWLYTDGLWQRGSMYLSQRDIDGWFYYDQPMDHLGLYVKIYQTNEPEFPRIFGAVGEFGDPGDKMVFDWWSQVDLAQYLICKYNICPLEGTKYEMYPLDEGKFMLVWGNTIHASKIRMIYDPAEDDYEY